MKRLSLLAILFAFCCSASAAVVKNYDPSILTSNLFTDIVRDRNGYLWIATEYGLNKFDGANVTTYYSDNGDGAELYSNRVNRLYAPHTASQPVLWLMMHSVVQYYDPAVDAFRTVDLSPIADPAVTYVHTVRGLSHRGEPSPGAESPWLYSRGSGFWQITPAEQGYTVLPVTEVNRVLQDVDVRHFRQDAKGRIWCLTTDHGLVVYYPGERRYRSFPELQYLQDLTIVSGVAYISDYTAVYRYDDTAERMVEVLHHGAHRITPGQHNEAGVATSIVLGTNRHGVISYSLGDGRVEQWLDGQDVSALYTDGNSTIWAGAFRDGISRIELRDEAADYIPIAANYSNGGPLYTALATDDGLIYMGQENNGMRPVDRTGRQIGPTLLPGLTVSALLTATDGTVYIGTTTRGVFRLRMQDGHQTTPVHIDGLDKKIKHMVEAPDGTIYIAVMEYGIRMIRRGSATVDTVPGYRTDNPYANRLALDRDGILWVGHYGGWDCYDIRSGQMTSPMPDATDCPNLTVYDMQIRYPDNRKVIYFATNKGLVVLDDHARTYTMTDGLPNNVICSILPDHNGHFWLSTFLGIACVDPDRLGHPGAITGYYQGNGLRAKSYCRSGGVVLPSGELLFADDKGLTIVRPEQMEGKPFSRPFVLSNLYISNQRVTPRLRSHGRPVISGPVDAVREIRVSYLDNLLTMQFATLDGRDPNNICYEYRLARDNAATWQSTPAGVNTISFNHLGYGRNVLLVRAHDGNEYATPQRWTIYVTPPFYLRWFSIVLYVCLLVFAVLYGVYRYHRRQERMLRTAKLKFFVDMSHELRSPLTLIKSPLDKMLARADLPSELRGELETMRHNTNRLLRVATEILSLERIENGHTSLHPENCMVGEWLTAIVRAHRPLAEDRGIQLHLSGAKQAPCCALDVAEMEKVVTNLLGNAIKFTPDGGEVLVRCSADAQQLYIEVLDTGSGINEKEVTRLFERFYQSAQTDTAHRIGFGVGLNLANRIVRLHGGTLTAKNRTDSSGSVFTITLPLATLPVASSPLASSPSGAPRIMVVDDDAHICRYLRTELSDRYQVETFTDAETCWKQILRHQPALLISDIRMPGVDGYELLSRIRRNAETTALPVILLTNATESAAHIRGLQSGAEQYVDKPFNILELRAIIDNLLARQLRLRGKFSGQRDQEEKIEHVEKEGNDEQLMARVMQVINRHLDNFELSVEMLADEVGLSRAQLQRRIKEITGTGVGTFIREIRLRQAAELLRRGDINIAQVAYSVGFTAPNIFSTAFRKYFGLSPKEYMEAATKNEVNETNPTVSSPEKQ